MQGYKNVERVKPSGLELVDRLVGVQRVTKVTKGGSMPVHPIITCKYCIMNMINNILRE